MEHHRLMPYLGRIYKHHHLNVHISNIKLVFVKDGWLWFDILGFYNAYKDILLSQNQQQFIIFSYHDEKSILWPSNFHAVLHDIDLNVLINSWDSTIGQFWAVIWHWNLIVETSIILSKLWIQISPLLSPTYFHSH